MKGTSMAAYRKGAPRRPSTRQRIFKVLLEAGDWGRTFDELMVEMGLNHSNSTSRLTELRKMGAITDSGKTRLTRNNAAATVWVVPPAVRAKAMARLAEKTE
jgi:hypothetical protein